MPEMFSPQQHRSLFRSKYDMFTPGTAPSEELDGTVPGEKKGKKLWFI